jgi:hypothetical protein
LEHRCVQFFYFIINFFLFSTDWWTESSPIEEEVEEDWKKEKEEEERTEDSVSISSSPPSRVRDQHQAAELNNNYTCDACGRAFLYGIALKQHIVKEHNGGSGDQLVTPARR